MRRTREPRVDGPRLRILVVVGPWIRQHPRTYELGSLALISMVEGGESRGENVPALRPAPARGRADRHGSGRVRHGMETAGESDYPVAGSSTFRTHSTGQARTADDCCQVMWTVSSLPPSRAITPRSENSGQRCTGPGGPTNSTASPSPIAVLSDGRAHSLELQPVPSSADPGRATGKRSRAEESTPPTLRPGPAHGGQHVGYCPRSNRTEDPICATSQRDRDEPIGPASHAPRWQSRTRVRGPKSRAVRSPNDRHSQGSTRSGECQPDAVPSAAGNRVVPCGQSRTPHTQISKAIGNEDRRSLRPFCRVRPPFLGRISGGDG